MTTLGLGRFDIGVVMKKAIKNKLPEGKNKDSKHTPVSHKRETSWRNNPNIRRCS